MHLSAQDSTSSDDTAAISSVVSSRYVDQVALSAERLERKLDKESNKMLSIMQKQEERIRRKLAKKDSLKAATIFAGSGLQYGKFQQTLQKGYTPVQYIAGLDTMSSSLNFLQLNPSFLQGADVDQKLKDAIGKVADLKNQFRKADEIKTFIAERKQYLRKQLGELGLAKELKKINKQAYYYSEQVNEYKSMLRDHKKAGKKAIELLSRTKLFKDFMSKHSMLAGLFPMPAGGASVNPGQQTGFAALQTRAQVTSMIQQASMRGPAGLASFQQNVQSAQSQLDALRNKLAGLGGGSQLEMPDFKPNSQRIKSFLDRLEWGMNFQTQRAGTFFPATSDIGFSIGYKLNDRSVIGVGGSYKVGLGRGWNAIRFSSQGLSLRSFIDWQIKNSFWLSGGYELNYRTSFRSIDELKDLSGWQESGLLGLSKVLSMKSKLLKKTKFQLFWDFLSHQQIPRTQPIIFRVGYSF